MGSTRGERAAALALGSINVLVVAAGDERRAVDDATHGVMVDVGYQELARHSGRGVHDSSGRLLQTTLFNAMSGPCCPFSSAVFNGHGKLAYLGSYDMPVELATVTGGHAVDQKAQRRVNKPRSFL